MTAPSPSPAPPPVSVRGILFGSGPRIARDAFAPVLAFYLAWRLAGLFAGIAAGTVAGLVSYRFARREDRSGALATLAVGFVLVQAAIGLISRSEVVYLAQPVLLSAALGVAFLASAFTRRPIIGIFATETYPFPPEVRDSDTYRRVFAVQSVVWGVFQLVRAGVRLLVLTRSGVDGYVLVHLVTGAPAMALMFLWSFWYGVRAFRTSDEWGPAIAAAEA